jgi:hypothetical protein
MQCLLLKVERVIEVPGEAPGDSHHVESLALSRIDRRSWLGQQGLK